MEYTYNPEQPDYTPDPNYLWQDQEGDYWWCHEGVWRWSGDAGDVGTDWGAKAPQWKHLNQNVFPLNAVERLIPEAAQAPGFVVKDSGVREEYANGFVRDTEDGKYDYARILAIPGLHLIPVEALERWGAHMLKGAEKYGEDNWRQARGPVAVARFLRSLCRHVVQYIRKDRTEDHAAAVCFNVWAAELTPESEG